MIIKRQTPRISAYVRRTLTTNAPAKQPRAFSWHASAFSAISRALRHDVTSLSLVFPNDTYSPRFIVPLVQHLFTMFGQELSANAMLLLSTQEKERKRQYERQLLPLLNGVDNDKRENDDGIEHTVPVVFIEKWPNLEGYPVVSVVTHPQVQYRLLQPDKMLDLPNLAHTATTLGIEYTLTSPNVISPSSSNAPNAEAIPAPLFVFVVEQSLSLGPQAYDMLLDKFTLEYRDSQQEIKPVIINLLDEKDKDYWQRLPVLFPSKFVKADGDTERLHQFLSNRQNYPGATVIWRHPRCKKTDCVWAPPDEASSAETDV